MTTWAVYATYVPDAVNRRAPYREAHLARARALEAAGTLLWAGAMGDPVDSALLIFRCETIDEVRAILDEDPYVTAGLWPTITIKPWHVVIGSLPGT